MPTCHIYIRSVVNILFTYFLLCGEIMLKIIFVVRVLLITFYDRANYVQVDNILPVCLFYVYKILRISLVRRQNVRYALSTCLYTNIVCRCVNLKMNGFLFLQEC